MGGVGEVFLDVGGEVDFFDAPFFVGTKDAEGVLEGSNSIVDSGKDVGVVVDEVMEDALLEEGFFWGEEKHGGLRVEGGGWRIED